MRKNRNVAPPAFTPHPLLRDGHAQTLYGALGRRPTRIPWRRERVELPDGDFVDLDHLDLAAEGGRGERRVLLVHGLGGSSDAPYVRGLARRLAQERWAVTAMNLRGASGEPNRLPRGYHGGDTADLAVVIENLAARSSVLTAVGFSLGGNALLKLLGEQGGAARVAAAVSVCAPLRLDLTARRLNEGLSRAYEAYLLIALKRGLWHKRRLVAPHLDLGRALAATSFLAWDELVTAPLNGFQSADDYWSRSSARGYLHGIARPTLILHALDDPFMPPAVLPTEAELSDAVTLEVHERGGHVGFVASGPRGVTWFADERVVAFLGA